MSGDFSPEQKRYLEGFTSGLQIARAGRSAGRPAASAPSGPDAEHIAAQDRTVASGGKLNEQERFKRDEHPFDAYQRLDLHYVENWSPALDLVILLGTAEQMLLRPFASKRDGEMAGDGDAFAAAA